MQQFIEFTTEYNKVYSSGQERNRKASIFRINLKKTEILNSADRFSPYGINKFFDISEDEFASTYLMSNAVTDSIKIQHTRKIIDIRDHTLTPSTGLVRYLNVSTGEIGLL